MTIGFFTCKQRQLYSNNGPVPFPVCQTAFSIPIETWVIYKVVHYKLFQGFSQFQEKPNNDTKASDLLRHFEDFLYI
jgi:hypothetical protein